MTDKIRPKIEYNVEYFEQNQTPNPTRTNISMTYPATTRPNTLPINEQRTNHPVVFTSGDYNNLTLSTPDLDNRLRSITTPDLINALIMTPHNDAQVSAGIVSNDGRFPAHVEHTILPTINQYGHTTSHGVSNTDNRKPENFPITYANQSNSHASSYNSQASSYLSDNESSNSTVSSSPSTISQQSRPIKDEFQNASSAKGSVSNGNDDLLKKEKKRERNRQAAQKCRTRKLARIAELQQRVDELQGKNKELSEFANSLKSDILNLEKKLNEHHSQGCALMNGSIS